MTDTAPEQPTLSQIFNAVVQEAIDDFPDLQGKLILVDLEEGEIHGLPNLYTTHFRSLEEVEKYLNDAAKPAIESNTSTSRYDAAHDLRVIFFNSAATPSFGGGAVSNALGVVDHELGHLVVQGGGDSDTPDNSIRSETAADLFAAIRHARRANNEGTVDAIRQLAFRRADALIEQGDAVAQDHFSGFALLELAEQAKTSDLSKMHPQMAAATADVLARQYAVTASESADLAAAFAGYRDALKSGAPLEQALRAMADATVDDKAGANTKRLGAFMLSFYLDGSIKVGGKPVALEGAYWDGIRAKLKAQEAPPAPSGLIIVPKNFVLPPAP